MNHQVTVGAIMTMPRLAHTDNMMCVALSFTARKIPLAVNKGVFWHKGLTQLLEQQIEHGVDYAITIDYDSYFFPRNVDYLLELACKYDDAAAVFPVQIKRDTDEILCSLDNRRSEVAATEFAGEVTAAHVGHFGLTVINLRKLSELPKPWFLAVPDADGGWGKGSTDFDVYFWRKLAEHGHTVYQANRCLIGHIEQRCAVPTLDDPAQPYKPRYYTAGDVATLTDFDEFKVPGIKPVEATA